MTDHAREIDLYLDNSAVPMAFTTYVAHFYSTSWLNTPLLSTDEVVALGVFIKNNFNRLSQGAKKLMDDKRDPEDLLLNPESIFVEEFERMENHLKHLAFQTTVEKEGYELIELPKRD